MSSSARAAGPAIAAGDAATGSGEACGAAALAAAPRCAAAHGAAQEGTAGVRVRVTWQRKRGGGDVSGQLRESGRGLSPSYQFHSQLPVWSALSPHGRAPRHRAVHAARCRRLPAAACARCRCVASRASAALRAAARSVAAAPCIFARCAAMQRGCSAEAASIKAGADQGNSKAQGVALITCEADCRAPRSAAAAPGLQRPMTAPASVSWAPFTVVCKRRGNKNKRKSGHSMGRTPFVRVTRDSEPFSDKCARPTRQPLDASAQLMRLPAGSQTQRSCRPRRPRSCTA